MSDIFISYASEDRARAKVLAGSLEDRGWSVWWDREVLPGRQFSQIIEEELGKAKCVIVLWSKESVESEWVRNEAREAARREVLVPVSIDNVDIPLEFSGTEAANLVDWRVGTPHPEFDRLFRAVCAILGQPVLAKTSETTPGGQERRLETKKTGTKSQKVKVLAAIGIGTLIAIAAVLVVWLWPRPKAPTVTTNSIGMKLVYIPAGSFKMGSSLSPEELAKKYAMKPSEAAPEFPRHDVRISKGFCMGQTEVTQGQYELVMNAQPWSGKDRVLEDVNNPAVYVSWDDAVQFCRRLSQQLGETYRLPTEAEWEYACRAGTTTLYSFGDNRSLLGQYAWFDRNALNINEDYAHPVRQKVANAWGLHDMHGNVWEWCSDCYGEQGKQYYSNSPSIDPQGPSSGSVRCWRGGSWDNYDGALRCSFRGGTFFDRSGPGLGFRVVREE